MTPEQLRRTAAWRRAVFFGLTFLTSLFATALMYDILRANGFTPLEKAGLALFFILFTWITGAFWTALIGFILRLGGRDLAEIHAVEAVGRTLRGRTAVIMPIYNEDTERVAAGLDVIWSSLMRQPQQAAFDLFILSDTRKPEIAAAEEIAWRTLVARHTAQGRIFYRRREFNTGRKAGNIADFVRSWGGAYDYAVVLDADSIMTGDAIFTLAAMMDAHPRAGIIQALPLPAGRDTLFARLVQFAARLNSPMLASGLAWWQLGEGNYWGHNAILRLRQFADHCDLPRLRGKPPLGGEILSHDFVEAAFMRRAGYEVWLLADLGGSWEEVPSNVIDYAARDRRWAQGNLQHLGLLPMRGLHWLSRIHLITGVLSYVSSPIWLLVLTLSTIIICMDALQGFQYFVPGSYTLFPSWPESRATEIVALLSITIFVLLMPKVLGAILALVKPELRRGHGGTGKLLISVLVEQVFSTLLAPAMMIFHTTFVLTTLAGKPVTWNSQERGDRGIGFVEAFRRHKGQILIGLLWGTIILLIAPRYIWWMMPILAGLVLSVPLTMLTSRASVGLWMRRRGLLLTPEETATPAVLTELVDRLEHGAYTKEPAPVGSPALAAMAAQTGFGLAAAGNGAGVGNGAAASNGATAGNGVGAHDTAGSGELGAGEVPQGIALRRADDIRGIQAPVALPERVPLQMEAATPQYLRPRDAWHGLHKLLSAPWSTTL
ncbi:MAG TPA: glucans biosynthesis glucosyltransferase MdoH [Steroidobacteraceae bacterium]|nr:glucans biosynthesis glucosyltransferase MdoH [Steroidobacteraceae bacterium]